LSTNVASEAISEHLILENFRGEMPPDPLSMHILTHAPSMVPPNLKYLPLPLVVSVVLLEHYYWEG